MTLAYTLDDPAQPGENGFSPALPPYEERLSCAASEARERGCTRQVVVATACRHVVAVLDLSAAVWADILTPAPGVRKRAAKREG